jgi:ribonuclease E
MKAAVAPEEAPAAIAEAAPATPAEEPVVVHVAAPEPVVQAADAGLQADPGLEEAAVDGEPAADKPKRRGWWSLGR